MYAVPTLEESIDIAAPPARVWELVSDVCRMHEWSPQVTSTRLRSGHERVGPGAEFTNRNRHGDLEWTTHAEITRWVPDEQLAFRIVENWVTWSFRLQAVAGNGTRLIQRRDAPEGISQLSRDLTDGFMGGQDEFTAAMRAGMRETLVRIREAAGG